MNTISSWTPNHPLLVFLAARGIVLARSTWPRNQPLPYRGEFSTALGFAWETNVDFKNL